MNKNKKILKILGITIGIIFLIILISFIFLMYQNYKYSKKDILTSEQFKTTLEKMNYEVEDILDEVSEYDYVKSAQQVAKENEYEIYYFIFEKDEQAKNYYENSRNYFEQNKGSKYSYINTNYEDYSKYAITFEDYYGVTIRVKNTILYILADKEYKSEMKKIIKELDY